MVAYKSGSLSNSQQGHSGGHPIQLGPGATGTTRPPGSAGMAQLQQQRIAVPQFTLPITLPVPFGNGGGPPKNLASQAMDIYQITHMDWNWSTVFMVPATTSPC